MARIGLVLEAGQHFGSGHAARMASLCSALVRRHEVVIATPSLSIVRRVFDMFAVRARIVRRRIDPTLRDLRCDLYVIDHLDTTRSLVRALRADGARVVTFDDRGAGARDADLVVNAIVGDWDAPRSPAAFRLEGPRYLVLSPAFHRRQQIRRAHHPPTTVVLGIGGLAADDEIRGLVARLDVAGVRAVPAEGFFRGSSVPLVSLLERADVAVTNGGLSMFESLGLGVPTVAVPRNAIEARSVRLASRRKAVRAANARLVGREVRGLLEDPSARAAQSRHARVLVDGRGLRRVQDAIESLLGAC